MTSDCAHKHDAGQQDSARAKRLRMEPAGIVLQMNAAPRMKRGKGLPAEQSEIVRGFLRDAGCVQGHYSEFARRLHYDESALSRLMRGASASADMVDAIHRHMRVNLWTRITQGRVTDSPNMAVAITNLGPSISPEAAARVRYQEHPDEEGADPSVEWWAQRLVAEQTIVRLLAERERPGRGKKAT